MSTQVAIIGVAFILFGIVAWIAQSYSPAYIGLMGLGVICLVISYFARD